MSLTQTLLADFDQEMTDTRRTLDRVPDDKFGWKPHEKSGTLAWLATHLAMIPTWGGVTIEQDSIDINPTGGPPPQPPLATSRAELLERFDKHVADARAALGRAGDDLLLKPWTLLSGGHTVFTLPRLTVFRRFIISHMIHHRAQLGVYLRLNGVAVPAIYGPSADESGM